ncbi:MAG: DEAD/DEAH box helicase [Culicoidibacterales bacterium]
MYRKGSILSGPSWREPVEVVSFTAEAGIGYYAELIGRQSKTFYSEYVLDEDLEQITVLQVEGESSEREVAEQNFLHALITFQQNQGLMKKNSQILPLPHQIEAVYTRMLKSPSIRYLLADDPGAGKTIMSGMLIQELRLRNLAKRILILVPPLVMRQWQEELASKFDLHFQIVNRQTIETMSSNPFTEHALTITSMYWGARETIKAQILVNQYDLVIIDEAHKSAAYQDRRKKSKRRTNLYKLAEALAKQTDHLLLLTATPHKGDRYNYQYLLQLLDEDLFDNKLSNEALTQLAQSFVIRRLKESMVRFDGSPLFPKRTTTTIQFELSAAELALYEQVTEYIREHFNRAKANGSFAVQFAMMLLQRRLSSSFYALHASLQRRYERLAIIEAEELKKIEQALDDEEMNEEIDSDFVGASDSYDLEELKIEQEALERLLQDAEDLQLLGYERKFLALEKTLFADDGLLAQGEKLLIFTESADTLRYLQTQLEIHLGKVAVIHGQMSLKQRQAAVEQFRNELNVMIATDAGGESINLQFCNQMVNYDIPWNPNRLEQRMGRIHRIGQTNEVFVFNLVAANTREGTVLEKLLAKLEIMRSDLGNDLVYDFLGELLEKQDLDLNQLMIDAIQNREHLTAVVDQVDGLLSTEHQALIEQAQQEQFAQNIQLPQIKATFELDQLQRLPERMYCEFIKAELKLLKIDVTQPSKLRLRVNYIPRTIYTQAQEVNISLPKTDNYTLDFAQSQQGEPKNLAHDPLIRFVERCVQERALRSNLQKYHVTLPVPEKLVVQVCQYKFVDGNERSLAQRQLILAQREDGSYLELDPNCFYQTELEFKQAGGITSEFDDLAIELKKRIIHEFKVFQMQQSYSSQEKIKQLSQAFEMRIENHQKTLNKLDSSNQVNIMKFQAKIREDERRKKQRIELLQREAKVKLPKIEPLITLEIQPTTTWRMIPEDAKYLIEFYEKAANRNQCRMFRGLGRVDFQSLNEQGEKRYIILASEQPKGFEHLSDYADIIEETYIYVVDQYSVKTEIPLGYYWK